ncbi:MAG TPA: Dickkopf N-terminal cysteine-rich domain-containing protein [Polyangia bacterium]
MRSLLLLSLAAASCGIDSYGDFRDELARKWCARQIRCGQVGITESSSRCSLPDPLLLTVRGDVDVPTAISVGRMKFHPDNASWCLHAVEHAPCDPTQAADDFLRECHGVVTGSVANGSTCWGDDECLGGVCVAPDCGGVCTPFAAPGAPCVPTGGTPDMTCDPSVHFCGGSATCEHKVQKGEPCVVDDDCLFDYVCVAGKCDTSARTKLDDVCGASPPPCADGLYCSELGACEPLLAAGQPCAKPDACKPGMTCVDGACAPWLDVGAACDGSPDAIASGCPATQTCGAGACAPVAGVKAGPLEPCATDSDCDDGLFCSSTFCAYVGGVNAACSGDHECATDLQCVGGACHTPGYILCAMPSTAN